MIIVSYPFRILILCLREISFPVKIFKFEILKLFPKKYIWEFREVIQL